MLVHLSIRNIVLIAALDLSFDTGLTVLTGETGAGKSILLDSLGLATGARADNGLIRHGEDKASVSAVFSLPSNHPVGELLVDQDIPFDGELILRRQLSTDGRGRAFINDAPVSARLLADIGELVLEIHGQHDERGLLDVRGHMALLDRYAGLESQIEKLGKLYSIWKDAVAALDAFEKKLADAVEEREYLTHVLDELERLAPLEGEEEELAARRQVMMNAEKVGSDLADAVALLGRQGGEPIDSRLGSVGRLVERASAKAGNQFDAVADQFAKLLDDLSDATAALESVLRDLNYDPEDLEHTEERLFALRAAARKHNVRVEDLPGLLVKWRADLTELDEGEEHLADLRQAVDTAYAGFASAAQDLSDKRKAAALKLDNAVMKELGPLKLDKAIFKTRVDSVAVEDASRSGIDQVYFEVATNPGSKPGPMIKVASGGELARFILALKVALAGTGSAGTLIFDEVDRGVGGATAAAVGARLATLASDAQVLVVTHSPQVAALGASHFAISKVQKKDDTVSDVQMLDDGERSEEIARMLSGAEVTNEARAAAAQLLKG